ncbi:hypothetical protein [Actinacidiphila oryziradicis]|uniref:Uncharacterized protein n=1 Tax=Actinacidiphila oryziradicis TaxID=2571141 RepID=A0A4U0SHL6_9ACTN|nr:hypothetical protein [Actinacidiphila oryziradicis]TJZ99734.1 hypothetical protein FCI23_44570 [Actinacidiphila oryziradicis]
MSRTSTPPRDLEDDKLLTRRRSISDWCDRHLMTIHTLSALMMDDPRVVSAALTELLNEPDDPPPAFGRGDPHLAALAPRGKTLPQPTPARLLTPRDQCPNDASSPLDRLELALYLIGDRTCAAVSKTLGLPEHAITARLREGLWVLFAPCDGDAVYALRGRLFTAECPHT